MFYILIAYGLSMLVFYLGYRIGREIEIAKKTLTECPSVKTECPSVKEEAIAAINKLQSQFKKEPKKTLTAVTLKNRIIAKSPAEEAEAEAKYARKREEARKKKEPFYIVEERCEKEREKQ